MCYNSKAFLFYFRGKCLWYLFVLFRVSQNVRDELQFIATHRQLRETFLGSSGLFNKSLTLLTRFFSRGGGCPVFPEKTASFPQELN